MYFSSIIVHRIIEEVKNHAVLYDKQHPSYNDEGMKERLWEAIGVKAFMKGPKAKSIWLSVCMSYLAALKIVAATNYILKEEILHGTTLRFMDNHLNDFVLDPAFAQLLDDITQQVNQDIERDRNINDDSRQIIRNYRRQVNLMNWTWGIMYKAYSETPQNQRLVRLVFQNGLRVSFVALAIERQSG